jgi:hypothetical protein
MLWARAASGGEAPKDTTEEAPAPRGTDREWASSTAHGAPLKTVVRDPRRSETGTVVDPDRLVPGRAARALD